MEGIRIMKDYILLPSDRDGYMHLYLYSKEGKLLRQIDKGNYDVTEIYGYDDKTATPTSRQLPASRCSGRSMLPTSPAG